MEIDNYSSVQRPASFPASTTNLSRATAREDREPEKKDQETTTSLATAQPAEEQFSPAAPRGSLVDISV